MSSRSVKKVLLIGNLGRDAETKFTPNGKAVTKFAIATNRRFKQGDEWREEVNFTNIVLWGQEALTSFLTKGKQVYIEGRIQTRSYDDKDGRKVYTTEVVAEEVILLGGKSEGEVPKKAAAGAGSRQTPSDEFERMGITDDDVPF